MVEEEYGSLILVLQKDLLNLILEAHTKRRAVIFFCSCEHPDGCHRATVARLLLKEAKRKEIALTIVEWPGGEPSVEHLDVSSNIINKIFRGAERIPLPAQNSEARQKFEALPWCSRVELRSDRSKICIISGPAKPGRNWLIPILDFGSEDGSLKSLERPAAQLRRWFGLAPRSSIS